MKFTGKFLTLLALAALLLVPYQAAQARGLLAGPLFGENYTLESGETLNEDLIIIGGSITIEEGAKVNGSIVLIGGSLTLDGEVTRDAVVIGGAVKLGSTAHIFGNIVPVGAPVAREEGARVDGELVNIPNSPAVPVPAVTPEPVETPQKASSNPLADLVWNVLGVFGNSVVFGALAMLVVLFLPERTRRIGELIPTRPVNAGLMGILSVILFITAILTLSLLSLLIITIPLTIPMILIASVIFAAASIFGWIGLGTELGLRLMRTTQREASLPLAAGLGTFLLNLAANGFGLLPCIGWTVPTLLGTLALGAAFMTRFGERQLHFTATPPTAESNPGAGIN